MKKYIIVLDNNRVTVETYLVTEEMDYEEVETFIQEKGHKLSEVSWMGPCEFNLIEHE